MKTLFIPKPEKEIKKYIIFLENIRGEINQIDINVITAYMPQDYTVGTALIIDTKEDRVPYTLYIDNDYKLTLYGDGYKLLSKVTKYPIIRFFKLKKTFFINGRD